MSALAHRIESLGIATTTISLIRLHTERIRPPRALWVPFQLGRPLGAPGNPAFQRRVLLEALKLLEHSAGPVVIEDFRDDEPGHEGEAGWVGPTMGASDGSPASMDDELARLRPLHRAAVAARGRTTVGLSGLSIEAAVRYLLDCVDGRLPAGRSEVFSPAQLMRFAADDVKAFWLEAASFSGSPSSRQLADWFWARTAAGRCLITLRALALASEDTSFKAVGSGLLVPGARVAIIEAEDQVASAR